MASTIAYYTGDGATTDYTVPFDYLAKKFVRVSVDLTILTGGDYGDTSKDYYFLDKTTVRLKVAPKVGDTVTIRRYTSATDRIISFKDASILKANDLDTASIQTIHIAEEGRDVINDALIVDKEGNWDAKGHRIVNVADPIGDNDAVNYITYKNDAEGARKSRDAAKVSETNAKESELNAKQSELNAKASETVAKASAGTAVSSAKHADAVRAENEKIIIEARAVQKEVTRLERSANDHAMVAIEMASDAELHAHNAGISADAAKQSELKAFDYAQQASKGQINADWNQADSTKPDYIRNKPSEFTPKSHTHPISQVTDLQKTLDTKTNDATLQVDLTAIRKSITDVSNVVNNLDTSTLSPKYAPKQVILDAADKALNGANPVHAGDPTLDQIKLSLATIQAQLGQLESRRYVKETGRSPDGNSWYRVWSDGWIEQGGITTLVNRTHNVTYPKVFTDLNYVFLSCPVKGRVQSNYLDVGVEGDRTVSGLKMAWRGDTEDPKEMTWYACGY